MSSEPVLRALVVELYCTALPRFFSVSLSDVAQAFVLSAAAPLA